MARSLIERATIGAALALTLATAVPIGAQPVARTRFETLSLSEVVAALRERCAAVTTAMTELSRRYPDQVEKVPDCGGVAASPDDTRYRAMDDDALGDAILQLSNDLEALVARGTAVQAAATAPAAPPTVVSVPNTERRAKAAPAPANPVRSKAKLSPAQKKECEAQQLADSRLCFDSSCRMVTFRRWQQCLDTGRYW